MKNLERLKALKEQFNKLNEQRPKTIKAKEKLWDSKVIIRREFSGLLNENVF